MPRYCRSCGAVSGRKGSGLCKPCEIERDEGPEAAREYRSRIGSLGARTKKLKPEELGELETPQDAMRWLRVMGQAVVTGRLNNRDAAAGIRAMEAWLKAHAQGVSAEDLADLRAKLEDVKRKRLTAI